MTAIKQPSSYYTDALAQAALAPALALKADKPYNLYNIIFLGNSFTYGTGTTGNTGGNNTGSMGNNTYPKQTSARLDAAFPNKFTYTYLGYPGKTARYLLANATSAVLAAVVPNKINIVCIEVGTNDAGSYTENVMFQDAVNLHMFFQNAGLKTTSWIIPNNKSSTAIVNFNARRLAFNAYMIANHLSFSDALCDLRVQPLMYTEDAPSNSLYFTAGDVDGFTGLHPSDTGAGLLAEQQAQAISKVLGLKMPFSSKQSYPTPEVSTIAPDITGAVAYVAASRSGLTNVGTTYTGVGYATSNQAIAGNGYILSYIDSYINNSGSVLGLDDTATLEVFGGFLVRFYPFYTSATDYGYYYGFGGNADVKTSVLPAYGDYYRINRVASTVTAEVFRNGVWTVIYTFPTSAVTLYPKIANPNAGKTINNPLVKTA